MRRLTQSPGLLISIVILLGFLFAPSELADLRGVASGDTGLFASGKTIRLATVIIAGLLCASIFFMRGAAAWRPVFTGSVLLLLLYALVAEATVVFSPLRVLTLYKATELLLIVMILAIVISTPPTEKSSLFYIKGIFWICSLFVGSALIETLVIGTGNYKQLVGATPFLSTMMQSTYPPMAGNALGYLGSLVALFGLYLFDSNDLKGRKRRVIAGVLLVAGTYVLVMSYTRSILIFFVLCVLLLFLLNRQFIRAMVLLVLIAGAALTPPVQDRVLEHMRRGMSDEQLNTLSGRTVFWTDIFSQSTMKIMVGDGFGAARLLSGEFKLLSKVGNAHNSVAEIIVSSGMIGALLWLAIMVRISFKLVSSRRRVKARWGAHQAKFHNFLLCVLVLSLLRSMMNSTFVYLEVFTFIFVSLILYTEVFCGKPKVATRIVRNNSNVNPARLRTRMPVDIS